MIERVCLALLALVLTGISLRAGIGHDSLSGRTLLAVTTNHGLDTGDLPVIAAWLLGMICCAILWRRLGRRR